MTIERALEPRGSARWAWLGTFLAVVLMASLVGELNPDWFGYERIYRDGGSWLLDQGRDPAFILLVNISAKLLGPDGYIAFRGILGAAFALFTYLLLRGRIIPFRTGSSNGLLLIIAILPLLAPRITIQIRECLAISLILIAVGRLIRLEQEKGAPQSNWKPGRTNASIAILMIIAYGLHSGTFVVTVCLFAAWLVSKLARDSLRIEFHIILAISMIVTSTAVLVAAFLPNTSWGVRTIVGTFGWLVDGQTRMSLEKWVYWLLYGWGIFALSARVVGMASAAAFGTIIRPFACLMALVLLPSLYLCALLLLVSGVPPIVVSAFARAINMLVALLLLLVAFRGRIGLRLGIFALFVLVDQSRIISEAVLTTLESLN